MRSDEAIRRVADGVAERVRDAVTRELQAFVRESSLNGAPASDRAAGLIARTRRIDEASSLSGVLDALAYAEESETARTAVYLVADGGLRLWKRTGPGWPESDAPPGGMTPIVTEVRPVGGMGNGFAAPIRVGDQVVAVLFVGDEHSAHALTAEGRETGMARLELLTRHVGRRLEALTAMRTAQLLAVHPEALRARRESAAPHGTARTGASGENGAAATVEHEAARRYARLLVSEIKLYHEPAVAAGLRDRDLASRLSGEIARARALYHERVSPLPEAEAVFHAELVRTLAGGDASLLDERKAKS
jgi:hypothetical protein